MLRTVGKRRELIHSGLPMHHRMVEAIRAEIPGYHFPQDDWWIDPRRHWKNTRSNVPSIQRAAHVRPRGMFNRFKLSGNAIGLVAWRRATV